LFEGATEIVCAQIGELCERGKGHRFSKVFLNEVRSKPLLPRRKTTAR